MNDITSKYTKARDVRSCDMVCTYVPLSSVCFLFLYFVSPSFNSSHPEWGKVCEERGTSTQNKVVLLLSNHARLAPFGALNLSSSVHFDRRDLYAYMAMTIVKTCTLSPFLD